MSSLFGRPELWPFLLAALLPIVLHLLARRRARTVDWPALRFFLGAARRRLRWIRIRELLLVALRTLALLALAIGLLDPIGVDESRVDASPGHYRALALVLDTSASLLAEETGSTDTAFDRARSEALAITGRLRPGDALVVVDGNDEDSAGDPFELSRGVERIREAKPDGPPFDLARAVATASRALDETGIPYREIFVLGDFPRTVLDATPARKENPRPRGADDTAVRLVFVRVGRPGATNLVLSALETDGIPAGTDRAVQVTARVIVPLDRTADRSIRWWIDDALVLETPLSEGRISDEARVFSLFHRFERGGPHKLRAALSGALSADAIASDNVAEITVDVRERLEVILLEPRGEREMPRSLLALALEPALADANDAASPRDLGSILRPVRQDSLEELAPPLDSVVVLAGRVELTETTAARLTGHLEAGGGVVLFAGSDVDLAGWNARIHRNGPGWAPARILPPTEAAAIYHLAGIDAQHPVFSAFAPDAANGLERIPFTGRRSLDRISPDASIAARFDDGSPWVIERRHGPGLAVLVTTAADASDGDFPRTPLFLPFVHRVIRHASRGASSAPAVVRTASYLEEARLDLLDDTELDELATAWDAELLPPPLSSSSASRAMRVSVRLWPLVFGAALLALLLEQILSRLLAGGRVPPGVTQRAGARR